MHFDYINDAPLDFDSKSFIKHDRLVRHRDIYMGNAAASLAVYTDGDLEKGGDAGDITAGLYRRPLSAVPRYKRQYARSLRECAAEYYCHLMFFSSLCSSAAPKRSETEKIEASFKSLENFRYLFCDMASSDNSAGYLWLICEKNDRLRLLYTAASALPPRGGRVILCLDLWEHAYTEAYGCDRAAYAGAFLSCADLSRLGNEQ